MLVTSGDERVKCFSCYIFFGNLSSVPVKFFTQGVMKTIRRFHQLGGQWPC